MTLPCTRFPSPRTLAVVMGLALLAGPVRAQDVLPEFFVDAVSVRPADVSHATRVDLYTRIPYPRLTFISSPQGFSARYAVTVEAQSLRSDALTSTPVQTRIWEGREVIDTYQATQSDERSAFSTQALSLAPGPYRLSVQVEDLQSSQVFSREVDVVVRDLNRPVALSDLTVLDEYDAARMTIVPRVTNQIGTDEVSLRVFFEVYANRATDGVQQVDLIRIDRDGMPEDEPVHSASEPARFAAGKAQRVVNVPVVDLEVGQYIVRVQLTDRSGVLLDQSSRQVHARWMGLEQHLADIDDAIEQLEYIAKKKDIQYMKAGQTKAERADRFRAFWEKRDPTPGTRRNEQMEEYYYRVAFANRWYGATIQDGWQTDRGFVMVRFGEPDFVQRRPHSFDYQPYEIWVYERIGRQFIFVDKSGFGDYQLLVPIWDDRTRLY